MTRLFWCGSALYAILLFWMLATGPNSLRSVKTLVVMMKTGTSFERMRAAESLAAKGPAGLPAILELMEDPEVRVRTQAVMALSRFRPPPAEAVPLLAKALESGDARLRSSAAWALQRQGPQAAAALPALIRALQYSDITGNHASSALVNIGRPALPDILAAAESADAGTRKHAARTILRMRPVPPESVPVLIALLKDSNLETQGFARQALAKIDTPEAMAALADKAKP